MYEVHPDNQGGWVLYETGDGGFDQVAVFADKGDAEFARQAFEKRDASARGGNGFYQAQAEPAPADTPVLTKPQPGERRANSAGAQAPYTHPTTGRRCNS